MEHDQQSGGHHQEEPQEERGAMGSRDEGEGPGGGPVDRPSEERDSSSEDSTKINKQEPIQPDMPTMPPA